MGLMVDIHTINDHTICARSHSRKDASRKASPLRSKRSKPRTAAGSGAFMGRGFFERGKPWENHGKTMGKPWENHGKTMGKPWENHGKTNNEHVHGKIP